MSEVVGAPPLEAKVMQPEAAALSSRRPITATRRKHLFGIAHHRARKPALLSSGTHIEAQLCRNFEIARQGMQPEPVPSASHLSPSDQRLSRSR